MMVGPPDHAATRRSALSFWWIAGIAIAIKLYLTSSIAIVARLAAHDFTNFLDHAQWILRGQWFGPYGDLTLIKGPGLPLYLAALARLGIPLPFGHQVLFALAALAACVAFRPIVRSGTALGIAFVALLFDPFTYGSSAWLLNRSQVMDSFALFVVAGGIGAVVRARRPIRVVLPWLVLAGVFTTALAMTREDTIWIAVPDLVFVAAYAAIVWAGIERERYPRLGLVAVPLLIFAGAIVTVMSVNQRVYGWATTVETTSPVFVSAYQSLSRIVVPGVSNGVYPAPKVARDEAYAVSPAAAQLKPFFDPQHGWQQASCSTLSLCDDVSAGWFLWALRDAVAGAGYYANGEKASEFYVRLSRELDAACDAGKLTCRAKSYALAPAIRISDIPGIVRYTAEAAWHGIAYDQYDTGSIEPLSATDLYVRNEYAAILGSAGGTTSAYSGWLLHPQHSVVTLDDPNSADLVTISFENSPDLRAAFGKSIYAADDLDRARFTVSTSCLNGCSIAVRDPGKKTVLIPLNPATTTFKAPGIDYNLGDAHMDPAPYVGDDFKAWALAQIVVAYQQVVRYWALAVALVIAFRLYRIVREKRPRRTLFVLTLSGGTFVTAIAHCAVLGVVCAVSFYALEPEYEVAIAALLLLFLGIETAAEGEIVVRWVRRRFARPKAVP